LARIVDLSEGFVEGIEKNEFGVVSTTDDPPKIRQGVDKRVLGTHGGRSLGCLSFDVVILDAYGRVASRDEHVLQQGKRTDAAGGEWYLGLKRPGMGSTDEAMGDAVTASWEEGFRSRMPVYAPAFYTLSGEQFAAPAATPAPTRGGSVNILVAPGGETELHMQGDGNLVVYDVRDPDNWKVIWSSGSVMKR
jgi:hypothetical protein